MTDLATWQRGNDAYLAAALEWLRLRLQQQAAPVSAPVLPTVMTPIEPTGWRLFRRQPTAHVVPETEPLVRHHTKREVSEEQVALAAAALDAAMTIEPPPALLILAQRLGLSRFEQELLLLCMAQELDTRCAALCARAQDDLARPFPTFALALALFDDPAWDVLSPERPLRYWRLIEITQPGAQPLTTSALRLDERILNYLKGLNYLDDRLAPLLVPFVEMAGEGELPPSQATAVSLVTHHLQQGLAVVQLVGPDRVSKQLVAQAAAAALGLHLYRLPVELLPTQVADLETVARLWQRESLLLPVALYLDAQEMDGPPPEGQTISAASALHRFLGRCQGLFFLGTREVRPGLGSVTITVEVNKPTPAEQQAIWATALNSELYSLFGDQFWADEPARLAGQFNLNGSNIHQIARSVMSQRAEANTKPSTLTSQLWDVCLLAARPSLDLLAQRLDAKATWDDVVLPEEETTLLHQIAEQVRQRSLVYDQWGFRAKMNRGLGINALFAGESGTGKTMAAEVIANELRLNLYRIDLSAVVSKYIGETEKNLRRLFDAAEDGGAILFFDEADALFGKRSEVKDSHDRYANIEINYLLQRIEAYRGLAILATNMKNALDPAFMRRLRFIVNFPFPGAKERQAIWCRVLPTQTPVVTEEMLTEAVRKVEKGEVDQVVFEKLAQEKIDWARLARLNLTGGSIHNIALNAAFLAAHADTPVTMSLLLAAARSEFRKLGRPMNEADFRER